MTISYSPPAEIDIDGITIRFNEERKSVRIKLGLVYTEDNQIIPMGESEADFIHQRRDNFKNINSTSNIFFLCYDSNDLLSEVEVHFCNWLRVNNSVFGFNDELDYIASELGKYSSVKKKEGEYLFRDIKVSIMNKNQMGDDGSTLGYFYFAKDIAHLED